jgi:branched-chain amino acid transport system substrate-binding protein
MTGQRRRNVLRGVAVLLSAGVALGLSACSSGSSSSSSGGTSGGLPKQIKVVAVEPQTGPAAFAGLAALKGYDVAINEINTSKYLGDSTIVLDKKDTAGSAQTAASEVSSAVADKNTTAIFGSVSSNEAVAQSPIAQKTKVPIIFTQAGSQGVVIGDYTFRCTPPMATYYTKMTDFTKPKGYKTVGVVYAAWSPTLNEIATKTLSSMGLNVVASVGTQQTTQDFSAPISQVLAKKPDVVSILLVGASNPTAMKQLRQAGYAGPVLGNSGASAGNLKPAGADGAGMVWAVDYSALNKSPSSEKFIAEYQKKFPGETPLNYAAEGYDAAWWLARALKDGNGAAHDVVQQNLAKVASTGFTGAMGDLKFEGNDLRLPGVLIQWDGTKEVLLPST